LRIPQQATKLHEALDDRFVGFLPAAHPISVASLSLGENAKAARFVVPPRQSTSDKRINAYNSLRQ
jgi:hypothetical protein